MAYIGRGIENFSQIEVLDNITFTNSAGPYNILKGAAAFVPSTVNSLLIEVDGIIQAPSSYTINGSTITFGVSMASTSTMNSMIHFGTGLITTPADLSVTSAKIASDAVTTAKILDNNVTVAKLPTTLDISGNTVTLPASVSGLGTGITNAQLAGSIDVTSKITGVVPTANLGSGTASSSTYLAGDQTYKEVVAIDIAWQSVVTGATLTAVAGRGYPINTTSNACTVTLPASASVGDQIIFTDYARNWATNALTINPNSLKYQGNTTPQPVYNTAGESIHIVYMDATKGWVPLYDGAVALETPQTVDVEYLVVAGGGSGGGGNYFGGGGGAGGYRTATISGMAQATAFTVTVGAGGAAAVGDDSGVSGSNSVFHTITSAGGGGGGSYNTETAIAGGSGGGGAGETPTTAGAGNTPSTSPVQGYAGGTGGGSNGGGAGGGGASEVGGNGSAGPPGNGGDGGDGVANSITGGSVTYAGGGGGSGYLGTAGSGGAGGGGAGSTGDATAGTANTGGGGGGAERGGSATSGAGGSGIVILRIADTKTATFSGGVTSSLNTGVSGYKIYSITATSSTSETVTF